jgi:hypothetical protein
MFDRVDSLLQGMAPVLVCVSKGTGSKRERRRVPWRAPIALIQVEKFGWLL